MSDKPSSRLHPHTGSSRQFPVSERYLFAAVLVALCYTLLFTGWTQRLDYLIYDGFLKLQPLKTSTSSAIVAIDEKSLRELGRWPWDRSIHADLITKLRGAGARAVVFDMLLTEPGPPIADQLFKVSMEEAGNVLLPLHIDFIGSSGRLTEILPAQPFVESAAALGHAQIELDADGIARGLYLYQGLGDTFWPSLALATYETVTETKYDITHNIEHASSGGQFNVREAYRLIPFVGPPGSFATLSYSDVLNSELPPDYFAGRVVFVGATAAGLGDFIATPVSGSLFNMPGVEVHANIYEALVQQHLGAYVEIEWQYLLSLSLVLIAVLSFPRISPDRNLPMTIALASGVLAFSYFLLTVDHQWFPPSAVLVTLLFAYPFWSWRRLSRLNRFLRQELERLAHEPRVQRGSSYDSPQQWAQHLARLIKPARWEFQDLKENMEPSFMVYTAQHYAEITLPVNDHDRPIALYLRLENKPALLTATVDYVKRLYPALLEGTTLPRLSNELVDRRIMQVHRAIAAMQEMREFISDTVSNMADGILVSDEFGRILFLNNHALRWLSPGAQPGEFIAEYMPVTNTLSPGDWETIIRQVIMQDEKHAEELYLNDSAVLVSLVPIRFRHRFSTGIIINFSDITAIHEAQRKRLETINFISHDLRAPLSSQLALLDNLRSTLPEEFAPKLDTAQSLTEKSLAMSEQFLQLARVEAADHIHLYECELLDVVDNAVDAITPLTQKQNIHIRIVGEQDSVPIIGNAELLERSIQNLLQNAVKFSPQKSEIVIEIKVASECAYVAVHDQGPGIAPEEIPTLFDPYRRTRSSEQLGVSGSGLGLRFVKLVMDRHGGEVKVDSRLGQGTSFTLIIPLKTGEMADSED
ncbi:histidine kinase [Hahella sp. CCB-MM4]|uniref:CHASE2 domain-containing protein n=1 Tax=Hahella sp. (strain CCB-MM4) TaxID=1926491 RepID=UPI000B9BED56|nr:CHASE2 domain-containing protein [Hahella sp. CCB-MM4]OZG72580.1 histidine kinase [Hahella sp. CCB-MM4]